MKGFIFYNYFLNELHAEFAVLGESCLICTDRSNSYDVKHLFSKKNCSSTTVACHQQKSVYFSHFGGCSGLSCSCRNTVSYVLTQLADQSLENLANGHEEHLQDNVEPPYLMVIAQREELFIIRSMCPGDFSLEQLPFGAYEIR
jgi:hypothetical protein